MSTTTFGILPALALMVPREGGNAAFIFFIQMAAIFGIFYFLLIRPQKKEQQRHQAMIDALKKGDDVVTTGGIIGSVVHAEQDRLTIKTAGNTRVEVERSRISRVVDPMAKAQGEG